MAGSFAGVDETGVWAAGAGTAAAAGLVFNAGSEPAGAAGVTATSGGGGDAEALEEASIVASPATRSAGGGGGFAGVVQIVEGDDGVGDDTGAAFSATDCDGARIVFVAGRDGSGSDAGADIATVACGGAGGVGATPFAPD